MNNNLKNLPLEIQNLITSPDIYDKIKIMGDTYDLHIDQIGELASEVRMVLMGITRSKDFIKKIMDRLEINQEVAEKIAISINKEIFDSIRTSLQKVQAETEIIDAGSEHDKDETLHAIENPTEHTKSPINVLGTTPPSTQQPPSTPNGPDIVDRMLAGPTESPATSSNATPTPPKYSTDPYREAM